jgi:hypothetical protein
MRRRWFKLFAAELLYGKFKDLTCEEFGIAVRLFCMASDNVVQGQISLTEKIPYSIVQIAGIINTKPVILVEVLSSLVRYHTIKIEDDIIFIINWAEYQSEYERQKPYRNKAKTSKLQSEVTTKGYTKRLHTEVEVEVEVEKDLKKEKETKPLTAKEPQSFNAVKYFFDKYLEYRQVKYVMTDNKAEAGILTTLCKKTGEDEYKRAIEAFHKSTDKFHTGGWTSYNLAKHINIWLAVVIDPNADNRIFLVKNNHYYVLNEGNDSMMYVKEEWEKDIVKFENKNGKKAVIRYE